MPKEVKIKYSGSSGFTLVELLLSLSLIAVVSVMSIPIYQSFQTKNDLAVATNGLVQSLRRAQILSQSMVGDSGWGVFVTSGSAVLFRGSSYGSRNALYDESSTMPTTITVSGLSQIVFDKFTGEPVATATGNIFLVSINKETSTIGINSQGMISY
ncbi:MAG: prepilin-type N-terminal cleavage/methylation domain-containing protein [Candidatus Buchananbacteria bacterium]